MDQVRDELSSNALIVKKISLNDAGNFTCTVTNNISSSILTIQVVYLKEIHLD